MKSIKVLVAEDNERFRCVLCRFLNLQPEIEVVGKASNGEEAISMYDKLSPDVVLMDLAMPVMNGITSMQKIKEIHPAAKVVVLTAHDTVDYKEQSKEAGADAYVLKSVSSNVLVSTIKKVISKPSHQILPD